MATAWSILGDNLQPDQHARYEQSSQQADVNQLYITMHRYKHSDQLFVNQSIIENFQ